MRVYNGLANYHTRCSGYLRYVYSHHTNDNPLSTSKSRRALAVAAVAVGVHEARDKVRIPPSVCALA